MGEGNKIHLVKWSKVCSLVEEDGLKVRNNQSRWGNDFGTMHMRKRASRGC